MRGDMGGQGFHGNILEINMFTSASGCMSRTGKIPDIHLCSIPSQGKGHWIGHDWEEIIHTGTDTLDMLIYT